MNILNIKNVLKNVTHIPWLQIMFVFDDFEI